MSRIWNHLLVSASFLALTAVVAAQQPPLPPSAPDMPLAPVDTERKYESRAPLPPPTSPAAPVMIIGSPPPPPPPPEWCGSVELGVSGAEGNSQLFKVRAASLLKQETKENIFKTDLLYAFANANDERTENRLFITSRYEWLLGESPWSIFVRGELEYDEFKNYDLRLGLHAGFGYTFYKDDATLFKGRIGAGASREIGGTENRLMPEGLIGGDFERKFTERQKFVANVDIFPDLGEIGEFRAELRACYEILIDPEWNLTFKIGAVDRYDSTPEGKKRNDVEYFGLLVWKF